MSMLSLNRCVLQSFRGSIAGSFLSGAQCARALGLLCGRRRIFRRAGWKDVLDEIVAQRDAQVGIRFGLGVRLRMQRVCSGWRARVRGVHDEDAGAVPLWVDQQLRGKASLITIVVNEAMTICFECEEPKAHPWLRAARTARIRRWLLARLRGG